MNHKQGMIIILYIANVAFDSTKHFLKKWWNLDHLQENQHLLIEGLHLDFLLSIFLSSSLYQEDYLEENWSSLFDYSDDEVMLATLPV